MCVYIYIYIYIIPVRLEGYHINHIKGPMDIYIIPARLEGYHIFLLS